MPCPQISSSEILNSGAQNIDIQYSFALYSSWGDSDIISVLKQGSCPELPDRRHWPGKAIHQAVECEWDINDDLLLRWRFFATRLQQVLPASVANVPSNIDKQEGWDLQNKAQIEIASEFNTSWAHVLPQAFCCD